MSLSILFKILGLPTFPKDGEEKFYQANATFNKNLSVTGQFVSQQNSFILGQSFNFGNAFFIKNPLDRNPFIPSIFGLPGGAIFGFSGCYFTGFSSFVGIVSVAGDLLINGRSLEAELAAGKALPYSSDIRLKENINNITEPIKKVTELRGVTFDFKESGKPQIGFIAQEVEKVIPEIVEERPDGYKGVHYGNLVALLTEAVKEQQKQINELKETIEELRIKK